MLKQSKLILLNGHTIDVGHPVGRIAQTYLVITFIQSYFHVNGSPLLGKVSAHKAGELEGLVTVNGHRHVACIARSIANGKRIFPTLLAIDIGPLQIVVGRITQIAYIFALVGSIAGLPERTLTFSDFLISLQIS